MWCRLFGGPAGRKPYRHTHTHTDIRRDRRRVYVNTLDMLTNNSLLVIRLVFSSIFQYPGKNRILNYNCVSNLSAWAWPYIEMDTVQLLDWCCLCVCVCLRYRGLFFCFPCRVSVDRRQRAQERNRFIIEYNFQFTQPSIVPSTTLSKFIWRFTKKGRGLNARREDTTTKTNMFSYGQWNGIH